MRFRGKIIISVILVFFMLYVSSVNSSIPDNEKEDNTSSIEKSTMDSYSLNSKELILKKFDNELCPQLITNEISLNDDDLYVRILCGSHFNSLRDRCHYHGLNVEITNYGLTTIDGHWYIKIDGKILSYMNEDWDGYFSIGSDEGLLIKIMPDKLFEYKKFEFFRCGRIDIDVTVNDIQLKATGFLWCKYILNLQQQ